MKIITVKGIGFVSAKPDYIRISLSVTGKDKDYAPAMSAASEKVENLGAAIGKVGFDKKDLKTSDLSVQADYESVKTARGGYKQVFAGYSCTYKLSLSFDFSNASLAAALSAISSVNAEPELGIAFTVRDPSKISEELLSSATVNARAKAEILCRAAGCGLGQLVSIDYNWGELDVMSKTRYESGADLMAPSSMCIAEIEPEDIHVSDSVTFTWEIN